MVSVLIALVQITNLKFV